MRDNSLHCFKAEWLSFIHDKESHESLICPRSVQNNDGINDDVIMRK